MKPIDYYTLSFEKEPDYKIVQKYDWFDNLPYLIQCIVIYAVVGGGIISLFLIGILIAKP